MTSDDEPELKQDPVEVVKLRQSVGQLESELSELRTRARERISQEQLKVAGLRAGMIDLDGIRLIDLPQSAIDSDGNVQDPDRIIGELKLKKPWLFSASSSSPMLSVPTAQMIVQKLATEMSDEEYRSAKASILKKL